MTRKDYWRFAAAFALAAGLSGCGGGGGGGDTDEPSAMMIEAAKPEPARLGEIMDGETVSEFVALGARQLSGAEIRAELVGVTLDEAKGSWTWNIGDDGMARDRADDNSWSNIVIWKFKMISIAEALQRRTAAVPCMSWMECTVLATLRVKAMGCPLGAW